jgi:hypothetical protein
LVPFDTRRFDDEGWLVVARPVQLTVLAERCKGALKVRAFSLPEKVFQSAEVRRPLAFAPAFWKRDEVATEVGVQAAPPAHPRREFPFTLARETVKEEPPTSEPAVPEVVRPPLKVGEEVAAPYTPLVPLETRRFDEEGWLVVARPVQVRFGVVPPEETSGAVAVTLVTCAVLETLPRPTSLLVRASMDLYVEVERPVDTPLPAVLRPMISP